MTFRWRRPRCRRSSRRGPADSIAAGYLQAPSCEKMETKPTAALPAESRYAVCLPPPVTWWSRVRSRGGAEGDEGMRRRRCRTSSGRHLPGCVCEVRWTSGGARFPPSASLGNIRLGCDARRLTAAEQAGHRARSGSAVVGCGGVRRAAVSCYAAMWCLRNVRHAGISRGAIPRSRAVWIGNSIGVGRVYGVIADHARTDRRAAACPPPRARLAGRENGGYRGGAMPAATARTRPGSWGPASMADSAARRAPRARRASGDARGSGRSPRPG